MRRTQHDGGAHRGRGRLLLHAAKCWWADGATRQGAASVLPDRRVPWRFAFSGAALAALLFQVAKFGIGWYIGRTAGAAVYGAAAALVVLMLWIYFSAQVFLLGAEYAAAGLRWDEHGEDAPPPAPTPESLPKAR